jgi:hypothetical protein
MGDYKDAIAENHQRQMDWINRKFGQIEDGVNEIETLSTGYEGIGMTMRKETRDLLKRAEGFDATVLPKTAYVDDKDMRTCIEVSQQPHLRTHNYVDGMIGATILLTTMLAVGAYMKRRRV